MNIQSQFKCDKIRIEKIKNYGVLLPKEEIGNVYCCIPLVDGMEMSITNYKGNINGEYEILYREVLPRGNGGVIRLPKIYMSCDVLLIR